MRAVTVEPDRIRAAWEGRISGCMPDKPIEVLSFQQRQAGLEAYLRQADALPLRDYIPLVEGTIVSRLGRVRAWLWFLLAGSLLATPADASSTHHPDRTEYLAPQARSAPTIDGVADEAVWERARWQELTRRWLGPEYTAEDFQGRYKVVWTRQKIYILGEFVDDILFDSHRDPLVRYWDDDSLEIFLDEDFSGGEHQYNHNAFAYHMSLDNQAIDIGTDKQPHNYSHHIESRWQQQRNKITWELAIDLYKDDYEDGSDENKPVRLSPGKIIGLMVAYCDNDGSELRENFIGSESIAEGPKDRGWIDAGLFGSVKLVK